MAERWTEHGYLEGDAENIYYWKARTLWKLAETMPIEHVPLESFDWTNENFQCDDFSKPPLWLCIRITHRQSGAFYDYPAA